jgi:hypothetical protein
MMRTKPLWRSGRERQPRRRRLAWGFAVLMAGALVPLVVVQSQASAYTVFCVGASWKAPQGGTMEEAGFPSVVLSGARDAWEGSIPSSDKNSTATKVDSDTVTYRLYPDTKQKFLCAGTSAAPCVVQSTVTITYETWESQNWSVSIEGSGSYMWASVKTSASYGREYGQRTSKQTAVTNMVPYKLRDVVQPAYFIEWRERSGQAVGGYFNTGATCRTAGEYGEQYEWREDPTGITFKFERNIGEGNMWMKETSPTEFTQPYSGQEGAPTIPS